MKSLVRAAIFLAVANSSYAQEEKWIWQFDQEEDIDLDAQTGHLQPSIARLLTDGEGEGEGEGSEAIVPTEPPTESPTAMATEPPTQAVTAGAPTDPPTEAPTIHFDLTPTASTPTEPPTTAPAETPTEPPTTAATPSPPAATQPTPPPTTPPTTAVVPVAFSFVIQTEKSVEELNGDATFKEEMKKAGLNVLGLSADKIAWIDVVFTATSRRLRLHDGRRLSNGVSVDYSANIPTEAIDTVSIVSDATALKGFVDDALAAAGVSDVTVDATSLADLGSSLGATWEAAVTSSRGTDADTTTEVTPTPAPITTTAKVENPWQPINFASEKSHLCTWAVLILQGAVAWFAVVPSL